LLTGVLFLRPGGVSCLLSDRGSAVPGKFAAPYNNKAIIAPTPAANSNIKDVIAAYTNILVNSKCYVSRSSIVCLANP
jgi:hypothetical protein